MLKPSYSELMDTINTNRLVDSTITSRYTIVLAAAKRARQIIDGANPLTYAPTDRAVSIAVKEMSEGKIKIQFREDLLDETYARKARDQYRYVGVLSKDDLNESLKENYDTGTYLPDEDDHDDAQFRARYGETETPEPKDVFDVYTSDDFANE